MSYTRRVKDETPKQVECRLFINGQVIHFRLPGPLVAMPVQTKKGKGEQHGR